MEEARPSPPRRVTEWVEWSLDAPDYIHGQCPPVIHCDIKPQNLKLTPRGGLFLVIPLKNHKIESFTLPGTHRFRRAVSVRLPIDLSAF
jgi:serine/threonine protein kinase